MPICIKRGPDVSSENDVKSNDKKKSIVLTAYSI